MKNNTVIKLSNATKIYNTEKEKIIALNKIDLSFDTGKFYAIMGHSGSGVYIWL